MRSLFRLSVRSLSSS